MKQGKRLAKVGGVIAACGALGAGGAYVGSATSPSSSGAASGGAASGKDTPRMQRDGARRGGFHPLRRAVHVEAVVPAPGGRFATVTVDRGAVENVEGDRLTLREGTRRATYKTLTLDIPSDAVIRINRRAGKLADVKAGQRAIVVHGPKRTRVLVHDARGDTQP